jgi:hypothetical protein
MGKPAPPQELGLWAEQYSLASLRYDLHWQRPRRLTQKSHEAT